MAKILLALCLISLSFINSQAWRYPNRFSALYPHTRTGQQCMEEGFQPNQEDCTKFVRCVNFAEEEQTPILIRFDFDCAPGTVYDHSNQICNHHDQVEGLREDCAPKYPEVPEMPEEEGGMMVEGQGNYRPQHYSQVPQYRY